MSLFQSKNASKMEDGKKEKENKKTRKSVEMGTTTATARSAYEAKVGGQALKRAGGNKNLKGHVFEQMRCDQYNYNPVTAPVLGPGSAGAGMIAGAAAAYAVDKTSRKAENKIKDLYQEAGSTENKANMRPAHGMA